MYRQMFRVLILQRGLVRLYYQIHDLGFSVRSEPNELDARRP